MAQTSLNSTGVASSGSLVLQSNGTTAAVTIDTSQNVGLGVTPSAWAGWGNPIFQFSGAGTIISSTENSYLGSNFYYNSVYKYIANGAASYYLQNAGTHKWFNAPTGTAGATVTFTQAMTLDASGNLGLGVTPSASNSSFRGIDVGTAGGLFANSDNSVPTFTAYTSNAYYDGSYKYKTSSAASYYRQLSGAHSWYTAASGTAGNTISFTQAMTLDASGNLLVGTTTSSGRITAALSGGHVFNAELNGTTLGSTNGVLLSNFLNQTTRVAAINLSATASDAGSIIFGTASGGTLAERARIDSSGNLLVGKTAQSVTTAGFEIYPDGSCASTRTQSTNGTTTLNVYSTGASAYRFQVGMGGTVYATSTSISAISDQTLKTNVRDLETGLTEVMALKPRRFDWLNGDASNVAGFIAQEVEEVLPELVSDYLYNHDEDGNDIIKKSLKMGDILPTLVKAIQEQQALITSLTARVASLEA